MFERFEMKAIKVIMLAQEEARRLGHNFVGTEQILLGLIGEGTGIAAKTLKLMDVRLKDARVEVERIIARGSGFVAVEIPFTPRAKRLMQLSWDEARQLGHNYIGTEHLLLGLIREEEGVAVKVLENLGVDLTNLRDHVLSLLAESEAATGRKSEGISKTYSQKGYVGAINLAMSAIKHARHMALKNKQTETEAWLGKQEDLFTVKLADLHGTRPVEGAAKIEVASAADPEGLPPNTLKFAKANASRVIGFAQIEARRRGHNHVATEHILLSLISGGTGIAARALQSSGVVIKDARTEVEKIPKSDGDPAETELPFTEGAIKVLEMSAGKEHGFHFDTEHILLSLIRVEQDNAHVVLKNLGVDLNDLESTVRRLIEEAATKGSEKASADLSPQFSFSRFTEQAIKVILLAQEEARRMGHNFVGTEQLMLGLIAEGSAVAAKTLESLGADLETARREVEKIIGRGSGFVVVEVPFTPRTKRVLELSWDEARQLGHDYIGTEHLLLGIVREGDGVAVRVLENLGIDLNLIRSAVIRGLEKGPEGV
jgi:ATP-dependent Clp protease ATP-binding subunit ClpA